MQIQNLSTPPKKEFRPIVLKITITDPVEAANLWSRLNSSMARLQKAFPDSMHPLTNKQGSFCNQDQFDLFCILDDLLHERDISSEKENDDYEEDA